MSDLTGDKHFPDMPQIFPSHELPACLGTHRLRVKITHNAKNGTYNHGAHFILGAMFEKSTITLLTLVLSLGSAGCAPLLISAAGAGAGAVFSHHANGQSTRTFTAPLPRVRVAVIAALKKMSIKPSTSEKTDLGERILAKAGGRSIEIELEVVTPSTTLMRTIARSENGLTLDSATATEITHQTEAAVGRG